MSLTIPVSCVSDPFSLLSRLLILKFLYLLSSEESDSLLLLDFLYFLSSDESDSLDDESDEDGCDYGSYGTYSFRAFSLCFDDSVGSVNGLGSGLFAPTGVVP